MELLLEGYDHILDAEDDNVNIVDVATERDHEATVQFLQSIPNYVVNRRYTQFSKVFCVLSMYLIRVGTWVRIRGTRWIRRHRRVYLIFRALGSTRGYAPRHTSRRCRQSEGAFK